MIVAQIFNEKSENCPKKFGKHKVYHKQLQRYSDGEHTIDTAWTIKKSGQPEKHMPEDDFQR